MRPLILLAVLSACAGDSASDDDPGRAAITLGDSVTRAGAHQLEACP